MHTQSTHKEKDKKFAPFLLAASFSGFIDYLGYEVHDGTLYFNFYPLNSANKLINQLQTKNDPHIPASDLFHAIEVFWRTVTEVRNGEIKMYGRARNL